MYNYSIKILFPIFINIETFTDVCFCDYKITFEVTCKIFKNNIEKWSKFGWKIRNFSQNFPRSRKLIPEKSYFVGGGG